MTTLKQVLTADTLAYGVWSGLDDPIAAEITGRSGFDFVVVDLQHGFASMASAPAIMNALEHTPSAPVIRVPWNTPDLLMRALDLGAEGVIVPMVSTAAEARQAVTACRYAPAGNRSWGPLWTTARRHLVDVAEGDEKATCIAMIETAEGYANIDEIVRVEGLTAVYVGPNDLALSMGFGRVRFPESPDLQNVIERIVDVAHAGGIAVGVDCNGTPEIGHWRDYGVDFVISHTDTTLLVESSEAAARAARG
ncbi:HpcH/HpaI aldolase family protein [Paramicrobacterium humi]|nr:aldolase/citrate lyase family protein [Microbacterium humi]